MQPAGARVIEPADFIRRNTALGHHPLVPEIRLHLACELTPIWQATEAWLAREGVEPPFWAFAWPGSAAMARHILDHPETVAGRAVLDFAAGGGLAAIACAKAGAACVEAVDIDPMAACAIGLNAAANAASLAVGCDDIVGSPCRWDLILCGDVCYEAQMAGHILPWLRRMADDAEIWIADPGRAYRPREGLVEMLRMEVPTSLELEDRHSRLVTLSRLQPRAECHLTGEDTPL
jgi:predicted nicotinamide N-methyase